MTETRIMIFPVVGWSTATLRTGGVLVDLQLLRPEDPTSTERRSLPVGMSVDQAKRLIADLQTAVAAAEMGQAPSASRS